MDTLSFNTIETERLILREMTPSVFDLLFGGSVSESELMHIFGFLTQEELDVQRTKYHQGMATFNKSFLYYYLTEKVGGRNIGWCGFHTWYLQHLRAELGYGITVETEKRKGLMSEALKPIMHQGFKVMNLQRVEAFASPRNEPSVKLLKNLGFVNEGLMRKHFFVNDVYEDSAVFSLLDTEYDAHINQSR